MGRRVYGEVCTEVLQEVSPGVGQVQESGLRRRETAKIVELAQVGLEVYV
jgi:hypothetical protein